MKSMEMAAYTLAHLIMLLLPLPKHHHLYSLFSFSIFCSLADLGGGGGNSWKLSTINLRDLLICHFYNGLGERISGFKLCFGQSYMRSMPADTHTPSVQGRWLPSAGLRVVSGILPVSWLCQLWQRHGPDRSPESIAMVT